MKAMTKGQKTDLEIKELPAGERLDLLRVAKAKAKNKYGSTFWWKGNTILQKTAIRVEMRRIFREGQVKT